MTDEAPAAWLELEARAIKAIDWEPLPGGEEALPAVPLLVRRAGPARDLALQKFAKRRNDAH